MVVQSGLSLSGERRTAPVPRFPQAQPPLPQKQMAADLKSSRELYKCKITLDMEKISNANVQITSFPILGTFANSQ